MKNDSKARANAHEPEASSATPAPARGDPSTARPSSRGAFVFIGVIVGLMLLVIVIDLLRQ